jgi:hypothetical protein
MSKRMVRLGMGVMCWGMVLLLGACGGSSGNSKGNNPSLQDELNPFTWVEVSPGDLDTEVSIDAEIAATFSAVPDPASINPLTFAVNTFLDGVAVNGLFEEPDGTRIATFKPTLPLAYETDYEIILSGIEDEEGNLLEEDYYGTFSTGKELKVTAFNPQGDGVPINSKIAVSFSKPVILEGTSFLVEDSLGQPVSGLVTFTNNGTWVVFDRQGDLSAFETYTVTLTDISDLSGSTLEHSWSFTTGMQRDTDPLSVERTVPEQHDINADAREYLEVTFSKAINPMTVDADSFVVENEAGMVAGSFIFAGDVITFVPSEPLAFKTVYYVTLTGVIEDLAGNTLEEDYEWDFKTGFGVVSVSPAHLSRKVSTDIVLSAICSEALDPVTVNASTVFVTNLKGTRKGEKVAGTVSLQGDTITFTPAKALAGNNAYQATLSTGIYDLSDNLPLPKEYSWRFRTGK